MIEIFMDGNPINMASDETTSLVQRHEQPLSNHGTLTIFTAAVFIAGEIAGSGVLALPDAMKNSGWVGMCILVGCAILSSYTGYLLGESWCLVRERYPEYSGHVRYPYPAIGFVTFGKVGRLIVSCSINITLFGVAVVFLLIAADNISSLINKLGPDISSCYFIMVVAAVLVPLCWFGSPTDFWFVAVGATISTSIACMILVGNIIYDSKHNSGTEVTHETPGFESFFTAFGTIVFAFGGHPAFPTFQTDMKNPAEFWKGVFLAYGIVLAIYFPVSTSAYFVYGDALGDNVLDAVSDSPALDIVQILLTCHLILGFIIVINPFSQEMEELLKIPKNFTWKRMVVRTVIVGCVLFVAESVPHFGTILSLIGGSTTTLLAYVLPSVFYLKLCSMPGKWDKITVPFHIKVLNIEIVSIGIIAGIAATYSAIQAFSGGSFAPPCYVNVTASNP